MKINLQPMLEEMKQTRGNPTMNHPELVKLYKTHGHDAASAALTKHYREVDQRLTTEYVQL